MFIERPWGGYKILHSKPDLTVKILKINPGERLSVQKHALRSEVWYATTPGIVALVGDKSVLLEIGEPVFVDVGIVHRLVNGGLNVGYVVELLYGTYDEDDIERLEDDYGRGD